MTKAIWKNKKKRKPKMELRSRRKCEEFQRNKGRDTPLIPSQMSPRPPDKSVYLKINFLNTQLKQMMWVYKRTS